MNSKYTHIRLTKIGNTGRFPDGLHPNGIERGYSKEAYAPLPPVIGEPFYMYHYHLPKLDNRHCFRTSHVTEILSDTEFKTENSIYKIEKL